MKDFKEKRFFLRVVLLKVCLLHAARKITGQRRLRRVNESAGSVLAQGERVSVA